jgi:hypothetical protein
MKFVELRNDLVVRLDAITFIQKVDEFDLKVGVEGGVIHDVTFPYSTLLSLLEMGDTSERDVLNKINESVRSLPIQVFAG